MEKWPFIFMIMVVSIGFFYAGAASSCLAGGGELESLMCVRPTPVQYYDCSAEGVGRITLDCKRLAEAMGKGRMPVGLGKVPEINITN